MANFEIQPFPFVHARHCRATSSIRAVRLIVIHSMEAPEKGETAEDVAGFFQTTDRAGSAHLCIDSDSIIHCVRDDDVAYAAPGAPTLRDDEGLSVPSALKWGFARDSAIVSQQPQSLHVARKCHGA